jgi:hypothetical protein
MAQPCTRQNAEGHAPEERPGCDIIQKQKEPCAGTEQVQKMLSFGKQKIHVLIFFQPDNPINAFGILYHILAGMQHKEVIL